MKRIDILTPLGIVLGLFMLGYGIMSGNGLGGMTVFINPASFLIVTGGLIGALLINFKWDELKLTGRVVKESFQKEDQNLNELISTFVTLSDRARREGLLALEVEVDTIEDPFIRKGIMLAVDGIEPDVITDIMNAEIAAMEERHQRGRQILEKGAEYAPAWGMLGTLIGLVLMLNNLDDPSTLGPNMAVALLTTLYGSLLANLLFTPMAGKLENKTQQEIFLKQVVIEGVIGVQSGQNPKILREKLSAFLPNKKTKEDEEIEDGVPVGGATNEI